MATLKEAKLKAPTKKTVENKLKVLERYKDYTLNEADVSTILRKKREFVRQKGGGDLHERHTLLNDRDIALRTGNLQEVTRINGALHAIGGESSIQPSEPLLSNGNGVLDPLEKKPHTLEQRRRTLAAGIGSTATKAPVNQVLKR